MRVTVKGKLHPNSTYNAFPVNYPETYLSAGAWWVPILCFYIPYVITDIVEVTGGVTVSRWAQDIRWFWDDNLQGSHYTTAIATSNNSTAGLENLFSVDRPILCVRVAIRNTTSNGGEVSINAASCSITAEVDTLSTISIGDKISTANMYNTNTNIITNNLKNYIDTLSTKLLTGNSISIGEPALGAKIQSTDWDGYIDKANALPHVSGLTSPGSNIATAAYYNNVVNAVCPPVATWNAS